MAEKGKTNRKNDMNGVLYIRNAQGELIPITTIKGDPGVAPQIQDSALGYKTWWVYNNDTQAFVDTQVRAEAIVQIEDGVITFVEDTTRENIVSGDVMSIILGKIKKWFTDLKALAFKDRADWDTDIDNKPTSMPASDVYAWAKEATKPEYAYSEITGTKPPTTAQKNSDITKAEIEAKLTGTIASHSHTVTKSDVGLSNVDNTSDDNKPISALQQTALNGKVDKVSGKGLSTNDFTDTYKNEADWAKTHTSLTSGTIDCATGKTFTITASGALTLSLSNLASIVQGSDVTIRVVGDDATERTITLPTTDVENETGMTTAIVNNSNSLELNIKRFGDTYVMKGVLYE
ncbi:MAG: hypothetical protein PHE09_10455 [Oscillospiraceae bacterium]|nr:hypothetical protein [Oscillospiraceae bacterium]